MASVSLVPRKAKAFTTGITEDYRELHEAGSIYRFRGYNRRVPSSQQPDTDVHRHHRHAVYASETTGLLLIAFLLLVLTLIRYWHLIHWSLH